MVADASNKAVVLLSGGLDSATTLGVAKSRGFELLALTVSYGQRHGVELEAAKKVAAGLGVKEHKIVDLDLRWIGGSALTGDADVPKDRSEADLGGDIPVTYVPARNTIFLALALAWAEARGAQDIFIGVNALDYSGYPDCRPEFIDAFQQTANLGTRAGVEGRGFTIHAPLVDKTKSQIILLAHKLGVDLSLTHSCYDPDPDGRACGRCDSCLLRKKGFAQAGLPDPTLYSD